ncbi:DHH family phosphoesterase [Paenibacillus alvei]|uniref:single-stranded-DNA-specific exonuclease RecJ n=1 Tax=Paenibacillus alvei TaxID=44250 RepID=UPI0022827847|nr:DHH family phosphoesterase [Paenibacillus alvei]MCY9737535.1 DHH family phosphoesterase [Paenibacillus alvei]
MNNDWKQRKSAPIRYSKSRDVVSMLLRSRGIDDGDFLDPPVNVLHDPLLMLNIELAADIITTAVVEGRKIAVSCDCDSDGIFSTAFMVRYLRGLTDKVYIVYAQRSMGHGIEYQMDMIDPDTDLLIILDSSSNSIEACKELSERGIDVIILDHHDIEHENDSAVIVNPKQPNCQYPNKGLSGVGVVYKMVQVLDETFGTGEVEDYIDLVACGMYADMMPVNILENRHLIIQGLRNIKNTGLRAILESENIDLKRVNSQTIGFKISPLINGVARMDQIELALDLLLSDNFGECMLLVKDMKKLNEERKRIEIELFDQYINQANINDKVIIITDKDARKNFNGLVANKIADKFSRPAMVLREHEGKLTGSYRSYADFNLRSFLKKHCSDLIHYAEGHEPAGGVSLNIEDLQRLKDRLNELLANEKFDSSLWYDFEIEASQVTLELIRNIETFDFLTGEGFPTSKVVVKGLMVEEEPKILGKNEDTVKIACDGMDAIKFKTKSDWGSDIEPFDRINVLGQLVVNEWSTRGGKLFISNQIIADEFVITS